MQLLPRLEKPEQGAGACVIVVASRKGGTGKTVTAANLAMLLHLVGFRVLAVDLDPQGHLTFSYGYAPDALRLTVFDVLLGRATLEQVLLPTCYHASTRKFVDLQGQVYQREGASSSWQDASGEKFSFGPDLAPINYKAEEEDVFTSLPSWGKRLRDALAPVLGAYHFIILDTNPDLNPLTVITFNTADYVLIPIKPEILSVEGLRQILRAVGQARGKTNPRLAVAGVLVTQLDSRYLSHQEIIDDLRLRLPKAGIRFFETAIKLSSKMADAANKRSLVVLDSPRSAPTTAYWFLLEELLRVIEAPGLLAPTIQRLLQAIREQKGRGPGAQGEQGGADG